MDYKKDLEIDKNNLDVEWQNQATLFCAWAEQEVEAQFDRDRAKEFLDLTRAELDSAIRKNPAIFDIDKITESAIANTILQSKKYKDANDKYLTALKRSKIMGVAREAFDHKKKALEKMTDLFLSGYWAEPREGKVSKGFQEERGRAKHYDAIQETMEKRRKISKK